MRLAVIGGGISGLAAAWTARRMRPDAEIVVLERDADVGGKARTVRRDDWLFENGPSGFLARPELMSLIAEAGLDSELVRASRAAKRRFVLLDGTMREIAPHPVRFARSGVLSARGIARVLAEPLVRRHRGGDESVWAFAARRLGPEFADRLIAPMTLGVFAGDARRLSLDAAFPRMRALEREHGSLILGLIAKRGRMGSDLTSMRGGMQELPLGLARRGGFELRTGTAVRAITRAGERWELRVDGAGDTVAADGIVLAGEPWAMAPLLEPHDAALGAELRAIRCPPVSVVALGYRPAAASRVPNGFGVLVARGNGYRTLGNLWESRIYPERAPDGHLLIRAMFGGSVDEEAGALDESALLALARAEVGRLYGITGEPAFAEVVRWPRAIPQYELGHVERVARIERAAAALPGVWLAGNALHGISFADAAAQGVRAGRAAAAAL